MWKIRFLSLMLMFASQAQGMGGKPHPEEFIEACKVGNAERVQAMLDVGADVNMVVHTCGDPILMFAVRCGRPLVVTQLIAAGANVNAVDKSGVTALMYAALGNGPDIATQLIAAGANVNAVDQSGVTALMYAAHGNRPDIVSQLIEAGAAVYQKTIYGETVLGFFERNGTTELVEELRKEIRWQGQGGEKAAWFAAVVQQQRAASRPGRVEIVE